MYSLNTSLASNGITAFWVIKSNSFIASSLEVVKQQSRLSSPVSGCESVIEYSGALSIPYSFLLPGRHLERKYVIVFFLIQLFVLDTVSISLQSLENLHFSEQSDVFIDDFIVDSFLFMMVNKIITVLNRYGKLWKNGEFE